MITGAVLPGGFSISARRTYGHISDGMICSTRELGIGDEDLREDKHLSEITALIDPRQFELISKPTSGLVVIQGGAGSGKTTTLYSCLRHLASASPPRCDETRLRTLWRPSAS